MTLESLLHVTDYGATISNWRVSVESAKKNEVCAGIEHSPRLLNPWERRFIYEILRENSRGRPNLGQIW